MRWYVPSDPAELAARPGGLDLPSRRAGMMT
jgi:hypothetical protein